jgi:hypothetical protein
MSATIDMTSGPTHLKTRKKRRQALRRLKRAAMQNYMVLRGWVPVILNGQYGIYHDADKRLVLRKWQVPVTPQNAFPYPYPRPRLWSRPAPPSPGHWGCQTIELTAAFNGSECAWNDIQMRWVYDLRAAAIGKGWL